jgi:hypothetical protein
VTTLAPAAHPAAPASVSATDRPRAASISAPSRATRMLATTALALGATSLAALAVALTVVAA